MWFTTLFTFAYCLCTYPLLRWLQARDEPSAPQKLRHDIYTIISKAQSSNVVDYQLPPRISRKVWDSLGDELAAKERECPYAAGVTDTITLRLDIRNMSTHKRRLCRLGVFDSKWDASFATIMQRGLAEIMTIFNADWGFTQSDEATILINSRVSTSERFEHFFGGRRNKLISLAAGTMSAFVNRELIELARSKGVDYKQVPLLVFDCRMGVWADEPDAFRLLLWRSYDCLVNGLSTAVYNEHKKLATLNSLEKLAWLRENGKLPLPEHQAYGYTLKQGIRTVGAVNQYTGQPLTVTRATVIHVPGNLLTSYNL